MVDLLILHGSCSSMLFKVIFRNNGKKGNEDGCKIRRHWSNRRVNVSEIQIYWLVLATGPGNPSEVQVLISGSVRFGSRPGQKPDPVCLGGVVTQTGNRTAGIWLGWNRTADPNTWFLLLLLQLSIWVLIVSCHSQYVNWSALAPLSPAAFKFAIWLIFVEWLWINGSL